MSKIAIIGPAYPYRGGPALVVANVYEHLVQKQHDVRVFTFSRLYPSFLFPGVRQEDISKHPPKQHPVTRIIDSINPFTWLRAAKEIIAYKPDIVLVDWYQPFFGACYRVICSRLRKAGIRILFLAENVISHEARYVDSMLTNMALSQADSYITFSQSVEESLKQWYPAKHVTRTTLPLFYTQESSPVEWTQQSAKAHLGLEGKRVLLFFGYIRKYKGLRNLIASFDTIAQQFNDVELLIVGECYEDANEYTSLINQTGVANKIRWINEYVPAEDVSMYYNAADIVVLPYISATQSGIVKIAFGFGKPVVATNVGGLTEEILQWNAGIVVEPENNAELIRGISTMLNAPNLDIYINGSHAAKEANSFGAIVNLIEQEIR